MSGVFKAISGIVSSIFGGEEDKPAPPSAPPPAPVMAPPPEAPKPTEPEVKPPTVETADAAVVQREQEDARRRRRGRASSLLTGSQGAGTPTTATKALLGE